jgi:hypothetical protein
MVKFIYFKILFILKIIKLVILGVFDNFNVLMLKIIYIYIYIYYFDEF